MGDVQSGRAFKIDGARRAAVRSTGRTEAPFLKTVAAKAKPRRVRSGLAPGGPRRALVRPRDHLRLEAGVGGEPNEQGFVGNQIVEH